MSGPLPLTCYNVRHISCNYYFWWLGFFEKKVVMFHAIVTNFFQVLNRDSVQSGCYGIKIKVMGNVTPPPESKFQWDPPSAHPDKNKLDVHDGFY